MFKGGEGAKRRGGRRQEEERCAPSAAAPSSTSDLSTTVQTNFVIRHILCIAQDVLPAAYYRTYVKCIFSAYGI